jgi:hypothetical protein
LSLRGELKLQGELGTGPKVPSKDSPKESTDLSEEFPLPISLTTLPSQKPSTFEEDFLLCQLEAIV